MDDLSPKRDQHAAALTYLDTGTLALADVLAALDDGPAEDDRSATRKARAHRRARWGAGVLALVAIATACATALAPSASAVSPFDDAAYSALRASNGWQCVSEGARERACVSLDGSVHSEVVADEGPGEVTFEATFAHSGKTVHTEVTSIHTYGVATISLHAAMLANPTAFPNMREGTGWLLWSTDAASANLVATALRANQP